MALIINIETSTEVCSVALSKDGKTIAIKENKEELNHSSLLSVFIDDILKENKLKASELDAVAVSMGPGSYTGLRIGVSTAKGLCYGAGIPLIAVSTLQAVALSVSERAEKESLAKDCNTALFCPMTDARRMEVYCALYDVNNKIVSEIEAKIIDENSFTEILDKREILFFGNGAAKCKDVIKHENAKFTDNVYASAEYMAALSEELYNEKSFADVAYFEPFYLKNFVATTPKKKVL